MCNQQTCGGDDYCCSSDDCATQGGLRPCTLDLFLLVGQSNMAGRGDQISKEDKTPHPRVLTLTKELEWQYAVDDGKTFLHFDFDNRVGVGPGKSFGMAVANADPEITVGLIPCAVGDSSIDWWEEGKAHGYAKHWWEEGSPEAKPWDDAIKRAKHAMQFGKLKGILWHQGEKDSTKTNSKRYEQQLHKLVQRFRQELNANNVPFIVGQMGKFAPDWGSWNKKQVDQAHRELPANVFNTAFVSSDGLTDNGDSTQLHFDSASYRELGERYAKEYLNLDRRW